MLSVDMVLYLLAAILFGLAGFNVVTPTPTPRWEWLVFCLLTISLIV